MYKVAENLVGGERNAFEKILPALTVMGRKILHTGELGTASVLKVITNYLASAHLVALGEAWTVAKKSNLDLSKTYKGIAISSGNSFVHETESQVILNGSYNINFTMDLVLKDTGLFDNLAKKLNAPLEISPQIGLEEEFEGATNPFPWMSEIMDLRKEKNFFETRVIEYQTGGALSWD